MNLKNITIATLTCLAMGMVLTAPTAKAESLYKPAYSTETNRFSHPEMEVTLHRAGDTVGEAYVRVKLKNNHKYDYAKIFMVINGVNAIPLEKERYNRIDEADIFYARLSDLDLVRGTNPKTFHFEILHKGIYGDTKAIVESKKFKIADSFLVDRELYSKYLKDFE